MRIRMLTQMPSGAGRNGRPWPAKGEVVELPTADAAHLVAAGVAEHVADEPQPSRRRGRRTPAAEEE